MAVEIVRANSVREAASILSGSGARFIAGGTMVVRAVTAGDVSIRKLVLSDGLGLDRLDCGREVEIGSAVTMATVAAEPKLGFLKPVAVSIGGPAVRAMATVGGNLFAPYPYGDFAVALLALGARVFSETLDGEAIDDLEAFLSRPAETGRVVRAFRFAMPPEAAFRFAKVVRRHPQGASVLSIAAMLPMTGGKVAGARVAYGAMARTPMRAHAVERALDGRPLDADAIAAAVKVATEGCAPLTDPQASAWYRMTVLPVHLGRLLEGKGLR